MLTCLSVRFLICQIGITTKLDPLNTNPVKIKLDNRVGIIWSLENTVPALSWVPLPFLLSPLHQSLLLLTYYFGDDLGYIPSEWSKGKGKLLWQDCLLFLWAFVILPDRSRHFYKPTAKGILPHTEIAKQKADRLGSSVPEQRAFQTVLNNYEKFISRLSTPVTLWRFTKIPNAGDRHTRFKNWGATKWMQAIFTGVRVFW